jgi:hypothetical protein
VTPSEEFVPKLCRETFLSLWSIANPRGKESGKELCDVLIVCDLAVIIVSVKGRVQGDARRQNRDRPDVKASVKQIFAAERLIPNLIQSQIL